MVVVVAAVEAVAGTAPLLFANQVKQNKNNELFKVAIFAPGSNCVLILGEVEGWEVKSVISVAGSKISNFVDVTAVAQMDNNIVLQKGDLKSSMKEISWPLRD